MVQQCPHKIQILFAAGNQFRCGEVMDFRAKPGATARIFVVNQNQPIFPSKRQNCGFFGHPMGVVAESLMKGRAFADRAVNQVGILGISQRINVRLNGNEEFCRCIWKLTQYRLTADDNEFFCSRDACGSPDDMLKL